LVKKYKHILFDLDHTLWDFEKNSTEALLEVYEHFHLDRFGLFSPLDFALKFKEVNALLWEQYNLDKIEKEYLRNQRFRLVLTSLGIEEEKVPPDIGRIYIEICPVKGHVIPNAFEVLDYLLPKYNLHVITNGFDDIQDLKLVHSKLRDYFDTIITSESAGHKKPRKEMFERAIELIGTTADDCIMIGDNPITDIQGAINASLDVIYFNPENVSHDLPVTHEIRNLLELTRIL
jgi:putative hydrolase of the HAD superfamily